MHHAPYSTPPPTSPLCLSCFLSSVCACVGVAVVAAVDSGRLPAHGRLRDALQGQLRLPHHSRLGPHGTAVQARGGARLPRQLDRRRGLLALQRLVCSAQRASGSASGLGSRGYRGYRGRDRASSGHRQLTQRLELARSIHAIPVPLFIFFSLLPCIHPILCFF